MENNFNKDNWMTLYINKFYIVNTIVCDIFSAEIMLLYTFRKSNYFPLYGNRFSLLSMLKVAMMQKVENLKNIFHV